MSAGVNVAEGEKPPATANARRIDEENASFFEAKTVSSP